MRTLIRSSQLHPEISGLIKNYSDPNYPNYTDIFGISGINTFRSGNYLLVTANQGVRSVNNLTGSITVTGTSGVLATVQNNNITISLTGAASVTTLNTLNGNINLVPRGLIDVWPLNSTQIAISGVQITGEGTVFSYYSGGTVYLRGTSIGSLNNKSGALNIVGVGGVNVINTGQNIFIDASFAALSGVQRINGIAGVPITLSEGSDIDINTVGSDISINYIGKGWGFGNYYYTTGVSENYVGNYNLFDGNTGVLINGNSNQIEKNNDVAAINSYNTRIKDSKRSTFINTNGGTHFNLTGSTFVNGAVGSGIFRHPYAFGIGMPATNTYAATMQMSCKLQGIEMLKALYVPGTKYSGIFIPTGSVIVGHIDYIGTRYDITDFNASFNLVDEGIYGRKDFIVQRGSEPEVFVRDQSDLFGGNNKYSLILSGSEDQVFYLLGSGYSGQLAEDSVDKVHDVLFMANVSFTNFNLHTNV